MKLGPRFRGDDEKWNDRFRPIAVIDVWIIVALMMLNLSRSTKLLLFAISFIIFVVWASWEGLTLALAAAFSDTRPELLRDAKWDRPETAIAFRGRYGRGHSEADLRRWLNANHFDIDLQARRATLRVLGVPCGEDVTVSWTAAGGTINDSEAVVTEAGCL